MRYFIITYVRKANGQIDEQAAVAKKIKPRDVQTANVIMDFKYKKVEKLVIEGNVMERDWDKLYSYYKQIYPAIIERLEKEAVNA
jgi:regulator of sigma D